VLQRGFSWPRGDQRGGDERQEQLVVPSDGVAVRRTSATALAEAVGRSLHSVTDGSAG